MSEPYRRTQRGAIVIFAAFLPMAVVVPLFAMKDVPVAAVLTVVLVSLLVATFSWMTVTVDDDEVRVKLGVGLGSRRVPLTAIRSAKLDQQPDFSGIGIRWLGGRDWLYNVSWGPVVALRLDDGRLVMIGSPEPDALLAATKERAPAQHPRYSASFPDGPDSVKMFGGMAAIVGIAIAIVVGILVFGSRPPTIVLDATTLTVSGSFYTSRTPLSAIQDVSLTDHSPSFSVRTNGFAFNGKLRGHFLSRDISGDGMVFVDRGFPPYLLVRTAEGFVLLNSRVADSTRALAERLKPKEHAKPE